MINNHRVCSFYALTLIGAVAVAEVAEHPPVRHRAPVAVRWQYHPGGLAHGRHGETYDFSALQQGPGVNMSATGVSSVLTFDPLKVIRFPK